MALRVEACTGQDAKRVLDGQHCITSVFSAFSAQSWSAVKYGLRRAVHEEVTRRRGRAPAWERRGLEREPRIRTLPGDSPARPPGRWYPGGAPLAHCPGLTPRCEWAPTSTTVALASAAVALRVPPRAYGCHCNGYPRGTSTGAWPRARPSRQARRAGAGVPTLRVAAASAPIIPVSRPSFLAGFPRACALPICVQVVCVDAWLPLRRGSRRARTTRTLVAGWQ